MCVGQLRGWTFVTQNNISDPSVAHKLCNFRVFLGEGGN